MEEKSKNVAVIVAHPDDETLWAGGTILNHSSWNWFILTLCRASDSDRAPRFFQAMKELGAQGKMGDLDDGPEQIPLAENEVQATILQLLPQTHFDLVLSHSPAGEYTRHRRHEEAGRAIIELWSAGEISTDALWLFAYEDAGRQYRPRPRENAHLHYTLPVEIWERKYDIITKTYGFEENGFEAETTPRTEAFWQFMNSADAHQWLTKEVLDHEDSRFI